MEKVKKKIYFHRSGTGHYTPKVSVPQKWLDDMAINKSENEVILEYNKEKKEIIIRK